MEPISPGGIGASVRRVEDPRYLRGEGRYVGDLSLPGTLHATFIRCPHGHARIRSVTSIAALAQLGVLAVFTGADLAARAKPITPVADLPGFQPTRQWPLAVEIARFAGEPVAVVLAESRYCAEDAADRVAVEYEPLPVVITAEEAVEDGAARVHGDLASNVLSIRSIRAGDPDSAIQNADLVVRETYHTQRHTGIPIETRGCVVRYDPGTGELTLWSSTQISHLIRSELAKLLDFPETRLRVVAPDVGGGFGIKAHLFAEELALCAIALVVRRPIKWIEDRREHLLASVHAREHRYRIEAGFRSDGTILGLKADLLVDAGAYNVWPWTSGIEPGMAAGILPGPYKLRHYAIDARAVATNKCPTGPFRAVARPTANFVIERVMDQAARELGLDPATIRLKNVVQPDEFPYAAVTGMVYDSGSYVESIHEARRLLDYPRLREEQERERERGRYIGIGLATYTEQTAHGPAEWARRGVEVNLGFESALVRVEPTGTVTVVAGIHSHGQGLETTLAQIVADRLGITTDRVRVRYGDTSVGPAGIGTFASRSAVLGGGAVYRAADAVHSKVLQLASHLLEAAPEDLETSDNAIRVRGVPGRTVGFADVARLAYHRVHELPKGESPGLEATEYYTPDARGGTFSNATHAAVVEVDPATGGVRILRYVVVEDCGNMINPLIVDGQVHGGVAQGIGGGLYEEIVYDEQGQLLDSTLMDYLVPSSSEIPPIEVSHLETPSPLTAGGFKGMGEGGAVAPPAALANAVVDALAPFGVHKIDQLPLSPSRVYRLIQNGHASAD